MARKNFLDYVYKTCIKPQAGYAFALNHTIPYSIIGVQEAHLATHYNPLYWACACLCCNAGSTVQDLDFDEKDEEESEENQNDLAEANETPDKKKRAAPNYGKIAKAIDDVQRSGVKIGLPDINESQEDFIPDVKGNRIIYSLRAVNAVSDSLFDEIMEKRPFTSVIDFAERMEGATPAQTLGVIKAGCFDSLEGDNRPAIAKKYLIWLAEREVPINRKLTLSHMKKAIATGMDLSAFQKEVWALNFQKWVEANQKDPDEKSKVLLTDADALAFFHNYIEAELVLEKDYNILPGGAVRARTSAIEKACKKRYQPLTDYFASEKGQDDFAAHLRKLYVKELWDKHCQGTTAQWEMEQMCFYQSGHELANADERMYGIVDFSTLPEEPVFETYTKRDGTIGKTQKTYAIAGTIVHVENGRHMVWLLTTHGVVSVKFYSELFNRYKSVLSNVDKATGKKTVIDRPWLKRGEKILVYGYRREDAFVVKGSMIGGYYRSICLIEGVSPTGLLNLRVTREKND